MSVRYILCDIILLMGKEGQPLPPEAKEFPQKGELYFLSHPGTKDIFSGYGLIAKEGFRDYLVGLLMVDRPEPVNPEWLEQVEGIFGEYQLVPMTAAGERGIVCHMQIEEESLVHLRQFPSPKAQAIREALQPLLEEKPKPLLRVRWDEELRLWRSQLITKCEIPVEVKAIFEKTGSGCLAVETSEGIIFLAHASDADVAGFANRPVLSQWQLIKMPTAPLIRFHLTILDQLQSPYCFETFFNLAKSESIRILSKQVQQDTLILSFLGDDLENRFSRVLPFPQEERQALHQLIGQAVEHLVSIPRGKRDFGLAKAQFQAKVGL